MIVINKVILNNFRSYEGVNEFDLSINNKKNIILIGGENGAGKSTLFESIKLCLYGYLAYNYQGFNSSYINKIKSNINNNAYKQKIIESYVQLDITIEEGTEKSYYTLKRNWKISKNKLIENLYIVKNNNYLNEEEAEYFLNYLMTRIPPEIFNFVFFDGDHISDFFISKNYNHYLRQALLTLCNLNNFELLKKHLILNTKEISSNIDIAKEKYNEFEEVSNGLEKLIEDSKNLNDEIEDKKQQLEQIEINLQLIEKEFRSSGGLLSDEREKILSEMSYLEKRRDEINQLIKDFCNDALPFLILKENIIQLKQQIYLEDEYSAYLKLKEKLNTETVKNTFKISNINLENIDEIAITFAKNLLGNIFNINENFNMLHLLSLDDKSNVLETINNVLNLNANYINSLYNELNEISDKISNYKQILNNQDDNLLSNFINNVTELNNKKVELISQINNLEDKLSNLEAEIDKQTILKDKLYSQYLDILKENNIKDISIRILNMLNDLTTEIINNKIKQMEQNFMYIFEKLLRKKGFITDIEILPDFTINLYTTKMYNLFEIKNLINNIGFDELSKKYGNKFIQDLYSNLQVSTYDELILKLNKIDQNSFLVLRTRIDVNTLSNGERQIYILCLYWALIKTSNIQIPFIIDTPYARIDETHRNNITTEYLPNISSQVIILSTNKEIDEESYNKIKEYISQKYLLEFNTKEQRTIIHKDNYFFEV